MKSEQRLALDMRGRSKRGCNPDRTLQPDAHEVHVLVYEHGTLGSGERLPSPDRSLELTVLAQSQGESPAEFTQRVLRQVRALNASGRRIRKAGIVLNSGHSTEAMQAREMIGRSVLNRFPEDHSGSGAQGGSGPESWAEFVAPGAGETSPEYRYQLFNLVDQLMASAPDSQTAVRIRFRPSELSQELARVPRVA
ncbi:MAG TPA: hypothetical protein VFQ61_23525 [Polyangiaceae bacterium]|nr:hypothetical protein [Polyangiaceae bacterium]